MFNTAVIEKLKHYVYYLQDPRTNKVFYVGKGVGNRVFEHIESAYINDSKTEKLDIIRAIIDSGYKVKHYIVRHALKEEVAFEIEASLIDFIGINNLSNLQAGHYSEDFGIKTTDEIIGLYDADDLITTEPILLININRLYHRDITEQELYEATRMSWVLGERREKVKYAIATYLGLTREVYIVKDWFPIQTAKKTRWGFNGQKADAGIRDTLRYKSIESLFKKGAANPIKYLNC